MLQSNNRNYWKNAEIIRKKNFNTVPVIDGTQGDAAIADLFKDKYSILYNCNCRSKLVSQLTNGQLNSKCDDTRRTLVCTGLLGKQGNQHHITGYGNESQQCLQSETVNNFGPIVFYDTSCSKYSTYSDAQ